MRIVLVDDEQTARDELAGMLERYCKERRIEAQVDAFAGSESLFEGYRSGWYDLAVLDCCLDEPLTGIDIARTLRARGETCTVVFATSSLDFALEGYEVDAAGYLVKPVTYEKLATTLDRVAAKMSLPQIARIESAGRRIMLDTSLLLYCKSDGHYVELWGTGGESKRIRANFKDVVGAFEEFPQIHSPARGYLVNFDHTVCIDGYDCVLETGERVPISKQAVGATRRAFSDYMFGKLRNR